jgi:hypothetical protein
VQHRTTALRWEKEVTSRRILGERIEIYRLHADGKSLRLKRFYRRVAVRKNRSLAKAAVARKLATRLYLTRPKTGPARNYVRPSCR